jgi:hypothetical protein
VPGSGELPEAQGGARVSDAARAPYADYYRVKLESGQLYQDFIVDLLLHTLGLAVVQYASRTYQITVGESRTGVEIKHDEKYAHTGNLWIEVAEKARPRAGAFVPSGIDRGDNSWLYVIGNYDTVFGFPKTYLRALKEAGRYRVRENLTHTSIGYLLPSQDAHKYAAFVLTPNAATTIAKAADLAQLGRVLHAAAKAHPAQGSLFGLFEDPCDE